PAHAPVWELIAHPLSETVSDGGVTAKLHSLIPSHGHVVPHSSLLNSPAMTVIDEQGRPEPPLVANELDTLLGFLDYQRATLEWKTRGLDAAGLNEVLAPSTMTLGGLLKHMAIVEEYWFGERLIGAPDIYA